MITFHQFIEKYPVLPGMEKLILGTIHPHDHTKFIIPFFYGNMNSIWSILAQAFPDELSQSPTLEEIKKFLNKSKIAVSDTIAQCRRAKADALDSNLIDIKFNKKVFQEIENSSIREILFTSGMGKNNAAKLFIDELYKGGEITKVQKSKISKDLKTKRESYLDSTIFGRPIKLTLLFSPSGSANVGISKSKLFEDKKHLFINHPKPVASFKVAYYKEKFLA